MLTTQDGTKIGQNVVSDVNANVTLPPDAPRQISPEAALLFNGSIVARPLMTPEVGSISVKNTEYRYRWVNRDSQGGRIFVQRKAQGFLLATNNDVDILGGDVANKDGEIRAGDLVLMKIRADLYDAAMKWNMKKALALQNMRGVSIEGASSDPMADDAPKRVSVSSEPFTKKGLATPFIPDNPDAIINDSIKSGRRDKTLQTNETLGK